MANLLRWRQRRGRNRFERETLLTAHPHVTYATVVSQIDPYAAPLATGCGELASRKNELGEGALSGFFSPKLSGLGGCFLWFSWCFGCFRGGCSVDGGLR